MKQRTITAAVILLVALVMLLTKIILGTTIILDAFWVLISVACALEMAALLKKQNKSNHWLLIAIFPLALFGLLYLEMALSFSAILSGFLVVALIVLFALIGFFITLLASAKTENEMRMQKVRSSRLQYSFAKSMNNVLGMLYPSVLLMFMFPLNHLAEISYIFGNSIPHVETFSIILVCLAFAIPFICDTFAYLTGKCIGGPRLCPRLSPKKTISGFIGGIVATILILVVLYIILASIPSTAAILSAIGIQWWSVAILGLIGALVCTSGDLFESFLKRRADVKDSGNFLPGHGGFLDRMDGFMFTLPVVAIFALILIL